MKFRCPNCRIKAPQSIGKGKIVQFRGLKSKKVAHLGIGNSNYHEFRCLSVKLPPDTNSLNKAGIPTNCNLPKASIFGTSSNLDARIGEKRVSKASKIGNTVYFDAYVTQNRLI